ncbi:MAG: 3TM-type holin [Pseudomonadales bacterium]|tara:strand:- start:1497 stop:1919 length:423 start_codon:yes stop_codon:yes gene_type:complete
MGRSTVNPLITQLITGIFKPAAELVDSLHTSEEERLDAKSRLLSVQAAVMDSALDYESKALDAKAQIVNSEANSEHWVTATWRPIVMLIFTGLVVARFLGFQAEGMSQTEYDQLWMLIQIGIGGYIGTRSIEKIVKEVRR